MANRKKIKWRGTAGQTFNYLLVLAKIPSTAPSFCIIISSFTFYELKYGVWKVGSPPILTGPKIFLNSVCLK
jgi:hypothetical protein